MRTSYEGSNYALVRKWFELGLPHVIKVSFLPSTERSWLCATMKIEVYVIKRRWAKPLVASTLREGVIGHTELIKDFWEQISGLNNHSHSTSTETFR